MEYTETDKPIPRKDRPRCSDCGKPGDYRVDAFGIHTEEWHCRECHEQQCRQKIRHDYWNRYGY